LPFKCNLQRYNTLQGGGLYAGDFDEDDEGAVRRGAAGKGHAEKEESEQEEEEEGGGGGGGGKSGSGKHGRGHGSGGKHSAAKRGGGHSLKAGAVDAVLEAAVHNADAPTKDGRGGALHVESS
jgi:hypothetical protein